MIIDNFKIQTEQFADIRILRYQVPGFENLTLNKKLLIYYLSQAALWGRDLIWDQNFKHNIKIRKTLEHIISTYKGDKSSNQFQEFEDYAKKVFFSNGIHHHYSMDKFFPLCDRAYFESLIENSNKEGFPINMNQSLQQFSYDITNIIYDKLEFQKRVSLDTSGDLVEDSACHYYDNVNQAEAESFYSKLQKGNSKLSWGINSTLIKKDGQVKEEVWKLGGKYSDVIEKMIFWLKKAVSLGENEEQKQALDKLIQYYETGDLQTFDDYCILWLKDINSTVDIIHGFIEVYGDPLGKKASYESLISIIDEEASKRAKTISDNASWFEHNSSTDQAFKKKEVKGVNARAVHVVMEAGDCSPATPIGINLPNADWIRAEYGSKSVTISNIIDAYDEASKGNGSINEFAFNEKEIEIHNKYSGIASKLHVDLHEIVGHGSGKLAEGVSDPSETLKSYASTIEEARADLVALYFALDEQLIKWGLMPSIEVGYCEYNSYIRGGLMTQLVRVEEGKVIEESHMRNRQLIAKWAFEQGKDKKIVEKVQKNNKTYFVINDYLGLQKIFGQLLKEVQRIKSEGDYEAAQNLVENYGVKVDTVIHKEVLHRWEKLKIAPYAGFINPQYDLLEKDGKIEDVIIRYPDNFTKQMLYYGQNYSAL
ncbi:MULTISPECIES: dihydrofolate reductase [unclassified Lentimicrobium]|uniref:dipeptidyl-peptidase 3 family protein n=1 Tax=unclassified Lentimicrobium TaxID=2677434 RepID=UPI0015518249|nr:MULTISPECIES: dihydrofolate reductase [unclassified Lentimicrobium]NPD45962.1 dihydrofolate reductase [Lentimicrobium sp. S6]NPD84271.1 dihydrofolate reductase [Lentimicrobium sp. L6]